MARTYRKLPELSEQDIQRFWKYVDKTPGQGTTGECWSWTRGRMPKGYGQFIHQRRKWYTHRIAFFLGHGIDPDQENVCHHCDYPPCCHPSHLFKGNQKINIEDCMAKGRKTPPPISDRKGIKHPLAKLNEADIFRIRHLRENEHLTFSAIADQYPVGRKQISDIVRRRTWKHI